MISIRNRLVFILLFSFFVSGCGSLAKIIVGKRGLEIPQIVAHLEPLLKENKITVLGKIIIQNPTQSDLGLGKIYLTFEDENNNVLGGDVLEWESQSVLSGKELEAPVKIDLDLSVLNKKNITVLLQTTFTYRALDIRIPVESKVAVLHLSALRETITKPLYVDIYTKLFTKILGDSAIEYVLSITNPLSIDLLVEDGLIRIYTLEGKDIALSSLPGTLFGASQSNQIKGSIKIGNIFGKLIRDEFIKHRPLRFQLSGKLRIPDTDIYIPFKIESSQELAFSLFGRR